MEKLMSNFLRWMPLPLATMLGVALTTTTQTQVLGQEAAHIDGFQDRDTCDFALALKPSVGHLAGPQFSGWGGRTRDRATW